MMHLRLATIALLLALPAGSSAQPGSRRADLAHRVDTHLQRGIARYAEREYDLAIVEFRAGYQLDPRPEFLFALAQAERLSGDCPTAVVYYERYLLTGPDANQAEAARINMRRCSRALESGPAGGQPTDEAPEQRAEPSPRVHAGSIERRAQPQAPRSWFKEHLGVGLVASGTVALAAAGGFALLARATQNDADDATRYSVYREGIQRARQHETISTVCLGLGGAAVVGAVYYYSGGSDNRLVVGGSGSDDHALVTIAGWF